MSFRADIWASAPHWQCAVALVAMTSCQGCFGINPAYDGGTSEGTAATETDATDATAGTSETSAPGEETDSVVEPVSMLPELAECVALQTDKDDHVGPDACEMASSQGNDNMSVGEMVVDGLDQDLKGREVRSYLKFAWDPVYTSSGVSVELVLHTAKGDGESSNQTGAVWKVKEFDLDKLSNLAPPTVGDEPLGMDQGMAGNSSTISWAIPASAFTEGEPLYLGVFPTTDDGVNYWNLDAMKADERPALVVHFN